MRKFVILILAIFIVITSIIAYFMLTAPPKQMSEAEKEAKLVQILGRKPNLTDTTPKGGTLYKGKYVSFTYPAAGKIYTYKDPSLRQDTSVLETFSFDIQNPRLTLNYSTIDRSNLSGLEDIPDVKLRQLPSSGYIQQDVTADGVNGLSFEKQDQQIEMTAFFFKNNKQYSISITGINNKDVEKLFYEVISSLKFTP